MHNVATIKAGTETARIWIRETSKIAKLATNAAIAAIPAEMTDAAIGLSGRTLAEAATSATTGYTANAT